MEPQGEKKGKNQFCASGIGSMKQAGSLAESQEAGGCRMSLNDGFKEAIGYLLSAFLPSSMVTNCNYISRTARDRADNKKLSWAKK